MLQRSSFCVYPSTISTISSHCLFFCPKKISRASSLMHFFHSRSLPSSYLLLLHSYCSLTHHVDPSHISQSLCVFTKPIVFLGHHPLTTYPNYILPARKRERVHCYCPRISPWLSAISSSKLHAALPAPTQPYSLIVLPELDPLHVPRIFCSLQPAKTNSPRCSHQELSKPAHNKHSTNFDFKFFYML